MVEDQGGALRDDAQVTLTIEVAAEETGALYRPVVVSKREGGQAGSIVRCAGAGELRRVAVLLSKGILSA